MNAAFANDVEGQSKVNLDSPQYRKIRNAFSALGFMTFALLYYVQSLLPVFSRAFEITPTQSSLALSVTTGVMAFAILFIGALSDVIGRKKIMFLSIFVSSILTVIMSVSPNWTTLLAIRFAMGVSLCGAQAVAFAYLSEELASDAASKMLGHFIGWSALGGMVGRMIASILSDVVGWRFAVAVLGLLGLLVALYFQANAPHSKNFQAQKQNVRNIVSGAIDHLRNPRLRPLFFVGFAVMSGFVTSYNFISFRLIGPPYLFSQTAIGIIFLLYVFGSVGAGFGGRIYSRSQDPTVLWKFQAIMLLGLLLTLLPGLFYILLGLAVLTFGMFASHSVASSLVSQRANRGKALAASLYLFAYYQGGSLIGSSGGVVFQAGGWPWLVALTGSIGLLGIVTTLSIKRN